MDIKASKSILAKLMAQENLTVVHAKVQTAYFDTKNRVLTLPVWTDMNGDLYDLLCGHEVGHALNTPAQGWHDAICGPSGEIDDADHILKGYLNVLEDARIEKKIKQRYPGLRVSFYRAYQDLFEKNFFGTQGKDLTKLMLIDRINLDFKLGSFVNVPFTGQEKSVVQRVEKLETWDEVVALARELLEAAKQELADRKDEVRQKLKLKIRIGAGEMADVAKGESINPDDYDDIEFEFDDDADGDAVTEDQQLTEEEAEILNKRAPISETDRAFREQEHALLDHTSLPYEYVTVPTVKAQPFIVGYREVMRQMDFEADQLEFMPETLAAYRRKNDKVVNYLVKEFELKRNAQQLARAKTSKSGEIDVKKLHSYRYNEDLFRRLTTVPNGKNHGLIMFYDMSGSMSGQMGQTLEQMIVLVEFCRKVNIPFEVYGFSNNDHANPRYYQDLHVRQPRVQGEMHVDDAVFHLRQYFSDSMRPQEYKQQLSNLLLLARIWKARQARYTERTDSINYRHIPTYEGLNGTPLNQSILLSIDIYNRFVERTKAEVVNMAFLTDGDADGGIRYSTQYGHDADNVPIMRTINVRESNKVNLILTHKETRKSVRVAADDNRHTNSLVRLVRDVTGANVVCFDIVASQGRRTIGHKMFKGYRSWTPEQYNQVEVAYKKFRRDRIFVLESMGFNEYYLIPGGNDLDIDDDGMQVEDGADNRKLFKAFADMQNNKTTSRVLLNRFIGMIA